MRTENWNGYNIRFVEKDGEWWAILKDICDALELRTDSVTQRLDQDMMTKVQVESNHNSNGVRSKGDNKTRSMVVVNELGIYEALFTSRRPEAKLFRRWSASILQKLRNRVGLEGYEVMRMTEPEVQEDINHILDALFFDEENNKLMISVTVQGGDVDQIPFDEYMQG